MLNDSANKFFADRKVMELNMSTPHELYWIWLTLLKGLGPLSQRRLLEKLGSPQHIFTMQRDEIFSSNELTSKEKQILANRDLSEAQAIFESCQKNKVKIVTFDQSNYPVLLKEIHDPPLVLYYRGAITDMAEDFPLAMIGSRRPSTYGVKMSQKFSFQLAASNVTIISGLARGIDALCHEGALRANKPTIAVIGNGADIEYPPENARLQKAIEDNGAVISEYPPGTPPCKEHFPARNRIISGLSVGVFILECEAHSGTMITAGFAGEYGRSLYTIPTNLDNLRGMGNFELIKNGASLVLSPEDILRDNLFDNLPRVTSVMDKTISQPPDLATAKILQTLTGSIPVRIDEIALKTGLSPKEINAKLTDLEMEGLVCCLTGKKYIKS